MIHWHRVLCNKHPKLGKYMTRRYQHVVKSKEEIVSCSTSDIKSTYVGNEVQAIFVMFLRKGIWITIWKRMKIKYGLEDVDSFGLHYDINDWKFQVYLNNYVVVSKKIVVDLSWMILQLFSLVSNELTMFYSQ